METFIENEKKVKSKKFSKIANKLLNKTILSVNGKKFRIAEIEFYLRNKKHNDEYVHGNEDQLQYGYWYFHKFPNGSYKGGTFKGLDLTLGRKNKKSYCGILIRSIYDISEKKLIEGPCNTVNKILSQCGKESIQELTKGKCLSALKNKRNFILEDSDSKKKTIYSGMRVGLSEKYPKYKKKNYRYLIYKDLIKKQKKDLK